jgi:hypothetical protein
MPVQYASMLATSLWHIDPAPDAHQQILHTARMRDNVAIQTRRCDVNTGDAVHTAPTIIADSLRF